MARAAGARASAADDGFIPEFLYVYRASLRLSQILVQFVLLLGIFGRKRGPHVLIHVWRTNVLVRDGRDCAIVADEHGSAASLIARRIAGGYAALLYHTG